MAADQTTATTTTRKPRAVRRGVVTSSHGDKTITVVMERRVKHRMYGKYIRRRTKQPAHDPGNVAKVGDTVEIMECRPISKTKKWRLMRVVKTAQG